MTEKEYKTRKTLSPSKAKVLVKQILGEMPLTAELYWLLRHRDGTLNSRYSLRQIKNHFPGMIADTEIFRQKNQPKEKVFIFTALHHWLHHASVMGLALSGLGYDVTIGYLPYADWFTPINRFDLRRQNLYTQQTFRQSSHLMQTFSFVTANAGYKALPEKLREKVEQISQLDTQYTLQIENVDAKCETYRLRLERNLSAARAALSWLENNKPDVVIVPNGTILEFGVVYEVARFLGIRTVTYEFGDQSDRIWIAQDSKVMLQNTEELWNAYKETSLSENENEKIQSLFEARRKASVWKNFSRRWQSAPVQGVKSVKDELGLDNRPVILLATNVLGDSLTLGRQIFTQSMEEWIARTVQYFAGRPDVQLIIRVHPGEMLTHGQSMVAVVHGVLPELPEYIHLIGPEEKVNTYDLIATADLGLVYTTTVGLEMAMSGVPVVVSGDTHYRNRGFTNDPTSWLKYYKMIGTILSNPSNFRLSEEQIKMAWAYAYRFFFNYPLPFPWHVGHLWVDVEAMSIKDVLGPAGLEKYRPTFEYLTGKPLNWKKIAARANK